MTIARRPPTNWYKDAVIYEVHVRAFQDSNDDGIGDFRGLIQRLDYLQDLGVTAIWLLPFYPSPLRDDGYDIGEYKAIHPSYGSLRDFKALLREAHARGLRVITELVVNHTSDQHAWFQRARRAKPGSPARDFYVWSDTYDRYRDARIIFKDFETSNWTWDAMAGAYYWHRFYSHQPDLNYDNPEVGKAITRVMDFWFDMGVDGMRLDALPYLFEREGTNCENLPETFEFLRRLRKHVDATYDDRMLLAEANQWPEDAVAYFGGGKGDGCHMAFHFPLMPRMFMAIRMEDRFPIIDILAQTPAIPERSQWALFLRNHDELTLEMVTDEERDYMYRVYAHDQQARINLGIRRRLAPLLGNDRRVIEMLNGLLFALPGTPVLYYGDEIGMGDNIYLGDRNGVRTPMQWSPDRNAGFSDANPQQLYLPVVIDPEYHPGAVNVEAQQNNPNSLLWWTKRLIALRKRYQAFGRGTLEFLYPENRKVLAFIRSYQDERILVVVNLSRFSQYVELDLKAYEGTTPVELFGQTEFPPIGELTYLLTLGPHAFNWFLLQAPKPKADDRPVGGGELPVLEVAGTWEHVFDRKQRAALEELLPSYLAARRWFGGKARRIKSAEFREQIPVRGSSTAAARPVGYLSVVRVEYTEGDPDTYLLPLAAASVARAKEFRSAVRRTALARLKTKEGDRVLFDAFVDPAFGQALFDMIARRRKEAGPIAALVPTVTGAFAELRKGMPRVEPSLLQAEQSNTSLLFGDRFILKLFRRLEPGINPDLEIGRYLTERTSFRQAPPVAGGIELLSGRSEPATVAILQGFVPNEGDAWRYTLDALSEFAEEAMARRTDPPFAPLTGRSALLDLASGDTPDTVMDAVGPYLESARLLGRRTAEMHHALAMGTGPAFEPEPFTVLYQRSLYQSMRATTRRNLQVMRRRAKDIPDAGRVAEMEPAILDRLHQVVRHKMDAERTRVHGDYHLGQVLWTGKDFVILDFEGEPALPLGERRIKRSPLRDVAGMIRSFHYAAYTVVMTERGSVRPEDREFLEPWARFWYQWVSASFLRAYLGEAGAATFLPTGGEDLEVLLDVLLLEKAIYELGYEANNRPEWLVIPVQGVLDLMEPGA